MHLISTSIRIMITMKKTLRAHLGSQCGVSQTVQTYVSRVTSFSLTSHQHMTLWLLSNLQTSTGQHHK